MVTKIKLEGYKELLKTNQKFFRAMKVGNRSAIQREARWLSIQMKNVAPHDTYRLRKAIEWRKYVDLKTGVVGAVVGITRETSRMNPQFRVGEGGQGWYPAYQEYGFFDKAGKYIRNSFVRPIFIGSKARIKKSIKDTYNAVIQRRSQWASR